METQTQVIKDVTFVSAGTNTLLSFLKIMTGIIGQSHALVADGFHSLSDCLSDVLIYFAAKAARRRPDQDHPYGHQRIETLSIVAVALLLLFVGFSILYEAVGELFHHSALTRPSLSVLIIALFSIVANEWLFRYTIKKGKEAQSDLLISNAWHSRSDAFTSLIVVVSVLGAYLGIPYLDLIGAGIISIIIIKMGLTMIIKSGNELIDGGVDANTEQQIKDRLSAISGIQAIHHLRSRKHGQQVFLDAHIQVQPFISVSEGHHISDQAMDALKKTFPSISDITLHVDFEDDGANTSDTLSLPSREDITPLLKAAWNTVDANLTVDTITLHYTQQGLIVDVSFIVTESATVDLNQLSTDYQAATQHIAEIKKTNIYFSTAPYHH